MASQGGSLGRSARSMTETGSDFSAVPSQAPPSASHGSDGCGQRKFGSRHVPDVAEELVEPDLLTPHMMMRFHGLLKHLKSNTSEQNEEKRILFFDCGEDLVPEEFQATLRAEFDRCCSFGERTNFDFMSSAKWIMFLRSIGVVSEQGTAAATVTGVSLGEADIIYHKVMHNCDHGGRRHDYGMFCKALCMVAQLLRPGADAGAAFSELLAKVVATAPAVDQLQTAAGEDPSLDANLLLVLDRFKPALHSLFRAFCIRNLSNPASPCHGRGTIRIQERSTWQHTRDALGSTYDSPTRVGRSRSGTIQNALKLDPELAAHDEEEVGVEEKENLEATKEGDWNSKDKERGILSKVEAIVHNLRDVSETALEAGSAGNLSPAKSAGTGSAGNLQPRTLQPLPIESKAAFRNGAGSPVSRESTQVSQPKHLDRSYLSPTSQHSCSPSKRSQYSGSPTKRDPYLYSGGTPVARNRKQFVSLDQVQLCFRELSIVPEHLSKVEVARMYKKVQASLSPSKSGNTQHSLMSFEGFLDLFSQASQEAYSREPFNSEYPEPADKMDAFATAFLPKISRDSHERFLYGPQRMVK